MTKTLKIRCVYKWINFLILLLLSREMGREQAKVLGTPEASLYFPLVIVWCSGSLSLSVGIKPGYARTEEALWALGDRPPHLWGPLLLFSRWFLKESIGTILSGGTRLHLYSLPWNAPFLALRPVSSWNLRTSTAIPYSSDPNNRLMQLCKHILKSRVNVS